MWKKSSKIKSQILFKEKPFRFISKRFLIKKKTLILHSLKFYFSEVINQINMKSIFTILILYISTTIFAQDSRLFENNWYLSDLIIDGIHHTPPKNREIPFVRVEFIETDEFRTGMCESGALGQIIYNGNTAFTFNDLAFLGGGCYENSPFNENFNGLFVAYWSQTLENTYLYSFTENGNNKTLTIVNSNGDKTIYGNELLSINDFKNDEFSIFPTSVEDIICIIKKKNRTLNKIMIFDIKGKLIQINEQIDSDIITINIQTLRKGIYFISLENEAKQIISTKFIKK